MDSTRSTWLKATGVGASVAAGVGATWNPALAVGATVGAIALAFGLLFPMRLGKFFLAALGVALIGYAFFNKGFAYFGVPPIFIGEIILALGVLALAVSGDVRAALRSHISWLLVLFALWGAVRTIPFIGVYKFDALRDGVLWGYGLFALLVPALLLRSGLLVSIPERYARIVPWFLVALPVISVLDRSFSGVVPRYSELIRGIAVADVPLIAFKAGDAAVHLAGVAVFMSLGLHQLGRGRAKLPVWLKEWFWWCCWLVGLLLSSTNRGGLVSVLVAALIVLALRPLSRWGKVLLIALTLTTFFFAFNIEIDVGDWQGRKVSPQQITERVQTVFTPGSGDEALEGNREWRLNWWSDIIGYTIRGEYFWKGKGFGINLAEDDGYQGQWEGLRSPHNGHMTILARMGVPGVALWALLQGAFALSLLRAYFVARRAGQEWWARIDLWILAYWAAFMVNGTFDVFLEGPQGGIWFWCLFGFGITILEAQREIAKRNLHGVPTQAAA